MDPQFFSILGLSETRSLMRSGLNSPEDHRDDEPWELGAFPESLRRVEQPCSASRPVATRIARARRGRAEGRRAPRSRPATRPGIDAEPTR